MKKLLFILMATLFSCERNDCTKKCNPAWMDDMTKSITQNGYKGEIIKYVFQNQEVYLIRGCLECADYIDIVKNCEGKTICEFGGITGMNTCPDFDKSATKVGEVWRN
jgi:hypothetical protein